jgi:hypothetical protein
MRTSTGADRVVLDQVALHASTDTSEVPNPIGINFGNQVKLIGYQVSPRLVSPGGTVTFVLFWRAEHAMARNYTGSVQIFDPQAHKYGQQDNWLLDGTVQTAGWEPGKIIRNDWAIALSPDTPLGVYDVQLVVYWVDEANNGQRLQRLTDDGNLTDDFLIFTQIRVEP